MVPQNPSRGPCPHSHPPRPSLTTWLKKTKKQLQIKTTSHWLIRFPHFSLADSKIFPPLTFSLAESEICPPPPHPSTLVGWFIEPPTRANRIAVFRFNFETWSGRMPYSTVICAANLAGPVAVMFQPPRGLVHCTPALQTPPPQSLHWVAHRCRRFTIPTRGFWRPVRGCRDDFLHSGISVGFQKILFSYITH